MKKIIDFNYVEQILECLYKHQILMDINDQRAGAEVLFGVLRIIMIAITMIAVEVKVSKIQKFEQEIIIFIQKIFLVQAY